MGITLSIFNRFSKLLLLEREVHFQQNPYNTSHRTFNMLPHYLAKVRSSNLWQFPKKNNLKIVSHLTKTEILLVMWLNIVIIVVRSVRLLPRTTPLVTCIVNAMLNMQKTLLQFTTLVEIKSSAVYKEYST